MNVKGKNFKPSDKSGQGLYPYGLVNATALAVNPSNEELSKILGINITVEEREYKTDRGNNNIVIYFKFDVTEDDKTHEFIKPYYIEVGTEPLPPSSNGNYLFINNKLQLKWAEDLESIERSNAEADQDWKKFDTTKCRIATKGEFMIYSMIACLHNIDPKDDPESFDVYLSDKEIEALRKGNIKEVSKNILSGKHPVKLLIGYKLTDSGSYRSSFFSKDSYVGLPAFTYGSDQVTENSRMYKFVKDIHGKGTGEYDWTLNYTTDFSSEPKVFNPLNESNFQKVEAAEEDVDIPF